MTTGKWIGLGILALVLIIAAGLGGYFYGVQVGQTRANQIRARFLQERGLTGQGGQGTTGRPSTGSFLFGQVKSVSKDTIELSTATAAVKVKITAQTQIQKMTAGTMSDIKEGERISVQGDRQADGTIVARTIQVGSFPGGMGRQ